jgi:uroporphyrinogen decarboxylase
MTKLGRRDFLRLMGMGAAASAWARPSRALARDMTHRQRIEAALKGEATDRAPFGFWWHFPNRDRSPRRLAELAVALQRRLDLDFIKFSPYGLYSVVDWGVTLEIFAGNFDPPVQAGYPIQSPDDWLKLAPLSGEDGEYLVLLEAQRIALDMLDGNVPFTQTIFSPLTSAAKMVGRDKLPVHLREHPAELHEGLKIITETTRRFVTQVVNRGADGLFFASQAVDPNYITVEEHQDFAKRYDLQVLEATGGKTWFDIFHLHGEKISFDQVLDYPVHAFNYHDRDYGPPLAEMRKRTTKCLLGGISPRGPIATGTPNEVAQEVEDAWRQLGGRGLIITPGEVVDPRSKPENVDRLRTAIEATRVGTR